MREEVSIIQANWSGCQANQSDIYGFLTKLVDQDGWILAEFFFACLWTLTPSRSINIQKKNSANIKPY